MIRPLRALLVDDERLARKNLREMLLAHPGVEVAGEADSVEAAARLAAAIQPEVVFLDVQMPPGTGFDLLPLLDPAPAIVFVTAHDTFAVRAFEANALDYLLKPVHPDRLAETVRRLAEKESPRETSGESGKLRLGDLVLLRDRNRMKMVAAHRIAAIVAEGAYTRVLISGEESMLILRSIGDWEAMLPSPPFVRADRSLLIHIGMVSDIHVRTRDEAQVTLSGVAQPVVMGRAASARLRKAITGIN